MVMTQTGEAAVDQSCPTPRSQERPMSRLKWLIAVPVVLVVLVVGGTWVYINVIKDDAPERLSLDDATSDDSTPAGDSSGGEVDVDGEWTVAAGSETGYRVDEILFGQSTEAVGRTESVTGSLTIDGTEVSDGSFEVDMTSVTSDESRRDGQFNDRIMETSTFPTAELVLTEPIDLGEVPADGERVSVQATGDLTLHGVTQSVTFDLEAQLDGDTFAVQGTIPVTFADYEIDNPSGGPAQVGDEGELEVLLVFEKA
jgi:polyisoprenoid-binding protein YceI